MIRSFHIRAWTRLCVSLMLILGICAPAGATNLTGTFKNPDGSPVNGKIIFLLSQPARLNDQSAQIVPMVKIFSVTSGALEAGAFVYGNDVLVPGGTYYLVRLVDNNNNLLFEQKWSISGVNLNLGTLTPTTTGVVFPDPLIKNLATDQAVQGPVSFSAPITAFSLTLNGNLNPGLPDSYQLGSSSAPWQELHAQRWNSLFAAGPSGGTAIPPAAAPAATVISNGGSIGAGTYYFKVTYFNKNGETTASPALTITVSSGTTNRIHVAPADSFWLSGCYGYIVYASSDNVNFYAQTPTGVGTDFQLTTVNGGAPASKTGHYNALGSFGARFNSLAFSGAAPPSTNTAAIDPLQVALNSTMRQSDFLVAGGTLFVGSNGSQYGYILTTPLIVPRYARIIGTAHIGTHGDAQGRIMTSFADPKLATVMQFGGFVSFENLDFYSAGNALMLLSGVGLQGQSYNLINSSLRTGDSTGTYSALRMIGVIYNVHGLNNYFRGGKAGLNWTNGAGSEIHFQGGRWDIDKSAIVNSTGWTDPDNGANDAGFQNAIGLVNLKDILFEQGTTTLIDGVNMGIRMERVQFADTVTAVGTDSLFKMGNDAFGAGSAWTILDSLPPNSANARVGLNVVSNTSQAPSLYVTNSSTGAGSSTGALQSIDMNNKIMFISLSNASVNFNPAATTLKVINVPNSTANWATQGTGNPAQATGGKMWNEFVDRIVLTSSTTTRDQRTSFFMNGNTFEHRQLDDATYNFQFPSPSTGFMNLRGNMRIQATGGIAPQLFIGPSASTAGGGTIATVNSASWYMRNAAGSADVRIIAGDASDRVIVGDAAGVCFSTATNCAPIKANLSATATLDFPNTAISTCSDLTMTVTGAADGDSVFLGTPNGSVPAGGNFFAWVSGANIVTARFCADGVARDPASGAFRATVVKF